MSRSTHCILLGLHLRELRTHEREFLSLVHRSASSGPISLLDPRMESREAYSCDAPRRRSARHRLSSGTLRARPWWWMVDKQTNGEDVENFDPQFHKTTRLCLCNCVTSGTLHHISACAEPISRDESPAWESRVSHAGCRRKCHIISPGGDTVQAGRVSSAGWCTSAHTSHPGTIGRSGLERRVRVGW